MLRFLYQAVDKNNKSIAAYIDAESIKEARAKLEAQGYSRIEFLDDEFGARLRMLRKPVPGADPKVAAAVEAKRKKTSSSMPIFIGFVKNNLHLILILAAIAAYGAWRSRWTICGFGVSSLVLLFGWFQVKRVPGLLYDEILKTMALGEWEQSWKLIGKLEKLRNQTSIAFDLSVRRACILARKGRLAEGLASLEKWRHTMNDPKGRFEGRLASVYSAAGDSEGFLTQMRLAYEGAPSDRGRLIDYALAQARFGDVDLAGKLLSSLDMTDLPKSHMKFVGWARSLIFLRKGEAESACRELAPLCSVFDASKQKAVFWTTTALMNGALAVALARTGKREQAKPFVMSVWPIFQAYADRQLMQWVKDEVLAEGMKNDGGGKVGGEASITG